MKFKNSLWLFGTMLLIWLVLTLYSIATEPQAPFARIWGIWFGYHLILGAVSIYVWVKYKADERLTIDNIFGVFAALIFSPLAAMIVVIYPNKAPYDLVEDE